MVEFPTLSSIFNKFENYKTVLNNGEDIPSNVVFNLVSSNNYHDTYTKSNLIQSAGTWNVIKDLEDAVNLFFISNPAAKNEYLKFREDLTDGNNFRSTQAYREIIIAYDIGKKIGLKNVILYYDLTNDKKPDLLLNLSGKRIILELTALKIRDPERKINEIASTIADYVLKKSTKSGYLISIFFDTMILNRTRNKLGHILVENAVAYLREMIDRLYLEELIGLNGSLEFHDRRIYLNGVKTFLTTPIEAIIHIDPEYDESKSVLQSSQLEILDNTKNKEDLKEYQLFEPWANKVLLNDFLNSPFDTISFETTDANGCIYINSLDFDSTDPRLKDAYLVSTSQIAKNSFIGHIKRRIDDKIERAQYEADSPFVLGIQASQWQYEYESDYDDFVPIRNEIQVHLRKYPQVSGVILFTSDLYYGKFVDNPDASQKVTKDIFEKSGILYKHPEPQFTHDRQVKLSGMDYAHKVARILELVDEEKNLEIPKDGKLVGYVKQDLEELLTNIKVFLGEKTIEPQVLSVVESVIKKYCKYKDEKEDHPVQGSSSVNKFTIILGDLPLRAYAAACLMRLSWHLRTSENVSLINLLAEDSNTYVRLSVCEQLEYYFIVNKEDCMSIAKTYCFDNEYVRWYLRFLLSFLAKNERTQALRLLTIIIETYGKTDLKCEDEDEDVILGIAASLITQISILFNENEYLNLFEDMVTNAGYNEEVKKEIIISMAKVTGRASSEKIINYYLRLLRLFPRLQPHIEFHLLYNLIQRKISLIPDILPLLDELSKTKYDKPVLGLDQTYHFTILDYIYAFFDDFPESGTEYFLRVMNINEFLIKSVKVTMIIKILEKIFDSTVDLGFKKKAKLILDEIDMNIYWQAQNLADKVKDL